MKFVVVKRETSNLRYAVKTNAPSVLHDSIEAATTEAKRLASINPGAHFDVYQLMPIGTATTQAVIWKTAGELRDEEEPMP